MTYLVYPDTREDSRGTWSTLEITPTSGNETTQTDIVSFQGMSSDSSYHFNITSPVNADIDSSGAGGLDTGSKAANQVYYLYVIGDTTGSNADNSLISLSATSPTMPSGYDVKRFVGSLNTFGSTNLLPLRKVNDVVSYYTPLVIKTGSGAFTLLTSDVTLHTSDFAKKARIWFTALMNVDVRVVYEAFDFRSSGAGEAQFEHIVGREGTGTSALEGEGSAEGWVDIDTVASVRSFEHQCSDNNGYRIKLLGFQEPL